MNLNGILRLIQASKQYKGKTVLQRVSLEINRGETVAVTGPNGSGKSTLLKLIAGLSALSSGKREVSGSGEGGSLVIGYAPDHLPKLKFTAREYLNHMASIRGLEAATRTRKIEELLELVDLRDRPGQQMKFFSKGMLQKVNLVQALLGDPELLLLDEPVGGLDEEAQGVLASMLMSLRQKGTAIVVASHEQTLIGQWADRTLAISDGRIQSVAASSASVEGKRWRRIVCQWPKGREEDAKAFANWPGTIRCRMERQEVVYWTDPASSDALLRELLEAGASIDSVAAGSGRMV
ncbi:ATP-binding cassette domain-containing protein [Cohnella hashimotonis]|uniref:ABC transporter ATP-binding protein n=1 Tax=Cohnella hashimotonis TaxID=2826895 RepID=A0ABT6T958_9BACL|nr:ABC transporter ATP-binding protein [Cohnella hashimotonis]MDI4643371.1 ABC transporter ATP-binding protein [Cohnella hashimotonis]